MLRLLIIDDEPYIVEWVYDLFLQQEKIELDIQKAYSAMEALTLLNRAKIDIVLTDIQMPDMDGISLMRAIKRNWPECRIIFLTAHDEFEYAHIASKDGIQYILKTETDEEIIGAVKRAAEEIEQSHWQQELLDSARRQMAIYRPVLQRDFLKNLLQGNMRDVLNQGQFDELEIPLSVNRRVMLLVGRTVRDNDGSLLEKAHESAATGALVDGCLLPDIRRTAIRLENGVGIWLIQPEKGEAWERTILGIKGALESLQLRFGSSRHSSSVFIADNQPCRWDATADRFSTLITLMNQSFMGEQCTTVTRMLPPTKELIQEQSNTGSRVVYQWLDRMEAFKAMLESNQKDSFLLRFSELKMALLPVVQESRSVWREITMGLSLMFLSYLNRSSGLLDRLSTEQGLLEVIHIDEQWGPEQAFVGYELLARAIFTMQSKEQISKEERLVKELHDYIQINLAGDLSLVRLAEVVYLSPAYLSRLYKQATGSNLSDFILQQRLEKARHLLTTTSTKIYEISAQIGFDSAAYFIRSFKKLTGITPQDYRNHSKNRSLDNRVQSK